MPVGLVIMRWDERAGTEVLAKYPEEIILSDKVLMQVTSTHEYSGETGMISLSVGSLNIASYYTGREQGYYILLLLNLEDDADEFEGGLVEASRRIMQNLEDNSFLPLMPSIFQRISVYPTLNTEQRLANLYQDEVKRMIINRLRDEGVLSKSELVIWLRDQYKKGLIEVESVLVDLIKQEIIKETSVKSSSSELLFLIHDILLMRNPPSDLIKDPSSKGLPPHLIGDYKTECVRFFQSYQPTEQDDLKILSVIMEPQVYTTLQLLRTAIVTRNDLEKLRKKGVDDLDKVLKTLWDAKMIQVFQDSQKNEYYALISDIYLVSIFPKYVLNTIKANYEKKSKADQVLVEYINVLENIYSEKKVKI
ncbi:MAG: hypothetical protein ACW986_01590 [Promethearchaeota archaeon]